MNTRAIAEEYRLKYWSEIIRERAKNGMSVKAYCLNAGFHPNIYYYWQRKIREAECQELEETPNETKSLTISGFAEVKLAEDSVLGTTRINRLSQLVVETNGVRITTDSEYPVNKLAELLRELRLSC